MQYSDKVQRATQDIIKLLEKKTSIEKIRLKMLMRYGLGRLSIERIIESIKEGL